MENIKVKGRKGIKLSILVTLLITSACTFLDTPTDVGGLTTVVNGLVIDNYSHLGIAGVPILIEDEESDYFPPASTFTYYDTIYTDSVGYYRYEFINKIGRRYTLRPLSTALYYNNGYSHQIDEGKQNAYYILYKPYRNLRFLIENKQKIWSHFRIYSVDQQLVIPWDFETIIADTMISMKFVPDVNIKFSVFKTFGTYGNADYKSESSFLNCNFGNRDTTVIIEY